MTNRTLDLSDALVDYMRAVSVHEHPELIALRKRTAQMRFAGMQIAPEQGQFMGVLTRLLDVRRALEIGVFTGYSALAVALALPPDGRLIACDINEEWTRTAREFWTRAGVADKIDLRIAPALETLQALLDEGHGRTFDFSFIDADKQNYWRYFELALALSRPGAAILIDNVLWNGRVLDADTTSADTQAIRAFNDRLQADARVDLCMLPLADGLTIARKR